ncbi:MAG: Nif3-like dinuclear metal center hexameric protein [Actinomycetia bacterium]|nr:Nif3-like dinuclear metal center hexameric protein [Actinomycetes bacterium]
MQVADLLGIIERLAPLELAQPGDNCGLLVGNRQASVARLLISLELTDAVLEEALADGCDAILTHHPLLFTPVRTLAESCPRERLVRRLIREGLTLIACHTNLDAARGGLAEIAGEGLGLQGMTPLEMAPAHWYKLAGFIPPEAVDTVAAAVFAAGAGNIGDYRECAFAAEGTGWFTPLPGSHPAVGRVSRPERAPEVRWETVVPRGRLVDAIRAFVGAHPYEEPAFDVFPVDDVAPRAGLGRVGGLERPTSVRGLAERTARVFGLDTVKWSGDGERIVGRVAVLPGSGRSLVETAAARCEVLISGDLGYHAAEQAAEKGLSLIDVPHGSFEWWAFRRWAEKLAGESAGLGLDTAISKQWRPPWTALSREGASSTEEVAIRGLRIWVDGGSRGNPGPSAIGVVVEDGEGHVLETVSRAIGVGTNNTAEYQALLAGLESAARLGATQVEVLSDSELLVKQMSGEYRVKNEGLAPLHAEARAKAGGFGSFKIRHVGRDENRVADALVNRALDEEERAGL